MGTTSSLYPDLVPSSTRSVDTCGGYVEVDSIWLVDWSVAF
jgi:hypothetical protein